ncbi:hypothetical protein [Chitinophaga sp. Cy-1792]|uniref:hypothetical protein n=1 Tax=Chitinophaga sp. Cy-1792 TaxID=2608339 RepID=UPI001422B0A7|nr:hypothetical protein [Chitinophaga sp. Cy-1792]NIG55336.1 hypothetical protein [Chitinophaga sp. Cy-1792]
MKKYFAGAALILGLFTACEKKVDPVNGNFATVTLNGGDKMVTGPMTVNPGDSITFDFTIATKVPMKFVSIQKNPVNQTAFVVRDTLKTMATTYSAVKTLKADTASGPFLYRIVAHDSAGTYIGSRDIVITTNPDFYYYTYKFLRVPDTTGKVNPCYISLVTGDTYSYSTGAANSAKIDLGIAYDTTGAYTPTNTADDVKFVVYNMDSAQAATPYYDLSSWTKSKTLINRTKSPAFNTLLSGGGLRSAAKTANLSASKIKRIVNVVAGDLIFFQTAAGKTGCMTINYTNGSSGAADSFINVDIKVER